MAKVKISELQGAALDWAVAKATGKFVTLSYAITPPHVMTSRDDERYQPSTDWAQGGPLIERYGISVRCHSDGNWVGSVGESLFLTAGETALIAAVRTIVAAMNNTVAARTEGNTVDIPDELVEG